MITIDDPRAEKAAQQLARQLNTTVDEAVAIACERMLAEQDAAARAKRRRADLDRVLDEIHKRQPLEGTPEERARLADHSYLYGPDGLPK